MRMTTKMLAGAAGLAAITAAAPAAAQYYPYGYNAYGTAYGTAYNPYGANRYAYGGGAYGVNAATASQQCTAAVQSRLYNRTSLGAILGSLVGLPTTPAGRVLSVTRETRTANGGMQIRGLASSGRYAYNNYGAYGVGAYGALGYGYNQSADLSFRCNVDYRGYVRNVDIKRR